MPYLGKTPSQGVRSRYQFTPNAGTTSLSGADANGDTLTFTDGNYVDVYLNGVMLKAGVDYVTTTANTIGSLAATVASDVVDVIVYDTFSLFGGTLEGNVKVNNGTLNVTGATDLDSTLNVDGNATFGGTVASTGVLTANAGVVVDNITIDGTTIAISSGDLTVDSVAGNLILEAHTNDVTISGQGTAVGKFTRNGGNFEIHALESDKDIKFMGVDSDATNPVALQLDMSLGGLAYFNAGAEFGGNVGVGVSPTDTGSFGRALDVSSSSGAAVYVRDSGGSKTGHFGQFNEQTSIVSRQDDGNIAFYTGASPTEKMRINSDGVGVGMTPDSAVKLSVSGAVGPTNGSNSAPTHTFYGDPDTGMYRSGANALSFTTGGTAALTLNSSQNATFTGSVTANNIVASGAASSFNSGGTNTVATFTSTDSVAEIQMIDNNGTAGISAEGSTFQVRPSGGAAKLSVAADGQVTPDNHSFGK